LIEIDYFKGRIKDFLVVMQLYSGLGTFTTYESECWPVEITAFDHSLPYHPADRGLLSA
jgi:hypothetical protein